jgi:hypothetical protein
MIQMKPISKVLVAGVVGASVLAFSAVGASAAIACSGNVCWHAKEKYDYPAASRVVVHEDGWKAEPTIKFREHEGRGYWKGDVWTSW